MKELGFNCLKAHPFQTVGFKYVNLHPYTEGGVCLGANLTSVSNISPHPQLGYWGDPEYPSEFLGCQFEASQCKGGKEFECSERYKGFVCAQCKSGYYTQAGECTRCMDNQTALLGLTLLTTLCIFMLWFGMNKFTAGQYDPADIGLQFMQISDIIGNFSLVGRRRRRRRNNKLETL